MNRGVNRLTRIAVALLGVTAVGAAQSTQSCPAVTGEPYLRCQVDRPAVPDTGNILPRYPDMLRQAKMSGLTRVSFVVDTNGRVAPASVTSLEAPHDLFASSVSLAVTRWSFAPAEKNGVRVAMRFEHVFELRLSADSEAPPQPELTVRRDTMADGAPRITLAEAERDPNAESHFTAAHLLEAQRSALLTTAPAPMVDSRGRPRVTACLTILDGAQRTPADSVTLGLLRAPGRRAANPPKCPQTYGGMILRLDRPRGWIDPSIMTVTRVLPWTVDVVVVTVDVAQGAAVDTYRCGVSRARDWRSTCRRIRSMVS